MNILVPIKWLKTICKTDISVDQISEFLTLKSSSVEKVERVEGDDVMDIEITPNRGDNLSILGIARELYAICLCEGVKAEFTNPLDSVMLSKAKHSENKKLDIKISDTKINPRFCAVVISNVEIAKSPDYVQKRLVQAGIRPINNVVDTTNYVMIETGQPMHAFDYDKIKNGQMHMRLSTEGETLTTLDGVNRNLPKNSIIIEDTDKIYDLCGIMGGKNSEIGENTKNVILFTQIYDPLLVRKTSLKLDLRSEAVQRFEKGIDPTIQNKALLRSLEILKESCKYEIVSPFYDINNTSVEEQKVSLDLQKLKIYANCEIPKLTCEKILKALQFKIISSNNKSIKVQVPPHRIGDVSINEDLIEEIVRIYGYDKISLALPKNSFSQDIFDNTNFVEREVKKYLKSNGFNEVMTMSMVPKSFVNLKQAVQIDNPMGADMAYMRTSHKPSLLKALDENRGEVNVFELSNVYIKKQNNLPKEILRLNLLSSQKNSGEKLVEISKNIFKLLNIQSYKMLFKSTKAKIFINKKQVGHIDFSKNYSYFQINFKKLVENYNKYPAVPTENKNKIYIEDLTIHTPINTFFENLKNSLESVDKNIASISYKDSFIKNGARALTISIKYTNVKKDLDDLDVKTSRENLIRYIESTLGFSVDKAKNYS